MPPPYPMVTKSEFKAIKQRIAAKRSKRAQKATDNAKIASILSPEVPKTPGMTMDRPKRLNRKPGQKLGKIRNMIKRGPLKKAIVKLLGQLDKKKNGPLCRGGEECPEFKRSGHHYGDSACHIVPQGRGDAARFIPENVYFGCRAMNYGECRNRSLYREKHIVLFGRELVERLEAIAKTTKQYSMSDLLLLRDDIKGMVEG